jgi:hypothetical protein
MTLITVVGGQVGSRVRLQEEIARELQGQPESLRILYLTSKLIAAYERIAELEAAAAWRPIEDAPTVEDATEFLLFAPKLGYFV